MSVFDRFRKDKSLDIGEEDSSIYKDDASENRWASFMFGVFALLLTVLIVGGVFFGARAIYRAVNGNDSSSTTSSNQPENVQPADQNSTKSEKDNTSSSSSQNHGTSPSSTPSTGDNLPNTGDNLTLPKTGDPGM